MGVESDRLFLRASSSSSARAHRGGARRGSFPAAQFARSKEGFVGLLEQILKEFLLALHFLLVSFSGRAFTAENLGLFLVFSKDLSLPGIYRVQLSISGIVRLLFRSRILSTSFAFAE
jgi:hypothetical protein